MSSLFGDALIGGFLFGGDAESTGAIVYLNPLAVDDRTITLPSVGLTKTGVKIKNLVIGDARRIKRVYSGLTAGITISRAFLTIKKSEKQADAAALVQKEITATQGIKGQITDTATNGGSIALYFDLDETDTLPAKPIEYVYDVQVELSGGETHTLEKGTIGFIRGVTATQG